MKKLILFIASILTVTLIACDKDSVGIEENLRKTPLYVDKNDSTDNKPDTTKKDIKTKFRSDSVVIKFWEKHIFMQGSDTITTRWTPLLFDVFAIVDTSKSPFFEKLFITAQRFKDDSVAQFRKEVILGFNLELDSFKLVKEYNTNKNNRQYKSKMNLYIINEKVIKTIIGDYPIELKFGQLVKEGEYLFLNGKFTIVVPLFHQQMKYNYFFIGEMNFRFKLD